MRSFAPLIGVAYTSWLLGAKKESKGLEALECSSLMCCGRGPQGSIQLERRLAQGRSLQRARYNLARSTIRQPAGSIGAAQHPRIERRQYACHLPRERQRWIAGRYSGPDTLGIFHPFRLA